MFKNEYEICLPYEVQTFPLPGPPSWPLTWPLRPLHCEHTRAETARIPRVALYTWWTGWRSSQCCWHIYRKDAKSVWWRTGHEIHELVNHSSETACQIKIMTSLLLQILRSFRNCNYIYMYAINFLFCIFSSSVCIITCNFKMNVFLFSWLVYTIGGHDFQIEG